MTGRAVARVTALHALACKCTSPAVAPPGADPSDCPVFKVLGAAWAGGREERSDEINASLARGGVR